MGGVKSLRRDCRHVWMSFEIIATFKAGRGFYPPRHKPHQFTLEEEENDNSLILFTFVILFGEA